MSLDGISTIFRGVSEPACIRDYASESLVACRATYNREVLSKVLDKHTPALQVRS
jgi:hypothetical protein